MIHGIYFLQVILKGNTAFQERVAHNRTISGKMYSRTDQAKLVEESL